MCCGLRTLGIYFEPLPLYQVHVVWIWQCCMMVYVSSDGGFCEVYQVKCCVKCWLVLSRYVLIMQCWILEHFLAGLIIFERLPGRCGWLLLTEQSGGSIPFLQDGWLSGFGCDCYPMLSLFFLYCALFFPMFLYFYLFCYMLLYASLPTKKQV